MESRIKYEFTAGIWQYRGKGAWHFVTLPHEMSNEIRENLKGHEEGWGRLKVVAKIGETQWQTAVWFDTKLSSYLLPLKTEIRKQEQLEIDKNVDVILWI